VLETGIPSCRHFAKRRAGRFPGGTAVISGISVTAPIPTLQFQTRALMIGGIIKAPVTSEVRRARSAPHDLAVRMSGAQQPKIFKLPIDPHVRKPAKSSIRLRRELHAHHRNWRQLPNGQIEFTMRHLPTTN